MGNSRRISSLAPIGGGVMRKKILFRAPVLTRSGYGEQSRYALRALRSREDLFDIYIQPLQWGQTSWISGKDEEREWIDYRIESTIGYIQQGGTFDVSFQVTIPNEWEQIAPINIGYTAGIETNRVAHEWLTKANEVIDNIITISSHSKDVYKNTHYDVTNPQNAWENGQLSLQKPIEFINYPTKRFDNLAELDLDLEYDFNFLVAAQISPRKNVNNTIKWFLEEFKDEEVGLVLKGNLAKNCHMDREHTFNDLRTFLENTAPDRKCKVYLLHGDMTDEEMHSLYKHPKISAFMSLAHGEGFGLPIFEAVYSGIPVVATGWSGQLDYLIDEEGQEQFYNVNFDLNHIQPQVVWDGVLIKESMWAYPREQSAKEKMRQCYEDVTSNNEDSYAGNADHYAEIIHERLDQEKMYERFIELILSTPGLKDEFDVELWLDSLDIEEHE